MSYCSCFDLLFCIHLVGILCINVRLWITSLLHDVKFRIQELRVGQNPQFNNVSNSSFHCHRAYSQSVSRHLFEIMENLILKFNIKTNNWSVLHRTERRVRYFTTSRVCAPYQVSRVLTTHLISNVVNVKIQSMRGLLYYICLFLMKYWSP